MKIKKVLVVVVTENNSFFTEIQEDDLIVKDLNSMLHEEADPSLFVTSMTMNGLQQQKVK